MFGKFLCARKIKELHQPKVVSRDDVQPCVGHTGAVDVSLVCISRPDANDFVSQNACPGGPGDLLNDHGFSDLLPQGNFMYLALVGSCGHLSTKPKFSSSLQSLWSACSRVYTSRAFAIHFLAIFQSSKAVVRQLWFSTSRSSIWMYLPSAEKSI